MEICVDSLESAMNASSGGAHRLELCSALSEGGLTPSFGLFKTLKSIISIPIFVMLRPKCGNDFIYSDLDIKVILEDLTLFKGAGADGFVFGALTRDGDIDASACASVISAADPLPVTFNRAFDLGTTDYLEMAQKIYNLGFKRLLTSGRCPYAIKGLTIIRHLVDQMRGKLIIMPGSGIKVRNLEHILITTTADEFHASAKTIKSNTQNDVKLNSNRHIKFFSITQSTKVTQLLDIYNKYNEQKKKNLSGYHNMHGIHQQKP